ncbi:MAG: prefoldin subunit [Candidatus Thalassarchaeaceae archaeon]|nr:prefoldin subunit [Candidatus Thalassarchaeaceae archaeon]
MSENIPLEQIVQELQMVAQQLVSVQTQVRELQGTIEHLSNQIEGNSIFQQVGPLLVEVDDIGVLNDSLAETCKQLNDHAEKLSARENELRSAYESAVKQFESA